ncbi:MAG: DUF1801 domain-containing protein [Planctomycetota bacterium]
MARRDDGAKPRKRAARREARPAAGTARRGTAADGTSATAGPRLLRGGNPQIAKGEGDGPVRAWLDALPGWKRDLGRRLDALIVRVVPGVRRAVKWNSPFYGRKGRGWIVGLHAFTSYLKVTFFQGVSLRPPPAGGTGRDARWIDVTPETLDEARLSAWLAQAAKLPGWMTSDIA